MARKLATAAIVWFALVGVAWLTFLRRVPSSPLEWLLLVAPGPVAYLVASALGEGVYEIYGRLPGVRHLHTFAESRASGRQLSWLRIGVYLATTLAFCGIIGAIAWVLRLP